MKKTGKIIAEILAGAMLLSCVSVGAESSDNYSVTVNIIDKSIEFLVGSYGTAQVPETAERINITIPDYKSGQKGQKIAEFTVTGNEYVRLKFDMIDGGTGEETCDVTLYETITENSKTVETVAGTIENLKLKSTLKINNLSPDKKYYFTVQSKTKSGSASFLFWTNNEIKVNFDLQPSVADSELCKVYFDDISGHWAENTINKWAIQGIISGYPDGTFKPDNPVTRAELAKILTLAFDLQPSEFVYSDRDLSEDAWYYDYLLCAGKYIPNYALPEINEKNQPYVYNRMLNAFLPEQNAMRMHVAESLVEIKRNKEQSIIDVPDITVVKEELNQTFKDADYEELFANHGMIPENVRRMFEYTYLANKLGIMQGDTDGCFRPYDNVTRAELITMLDRLMY